MHFDTQEYVYPLKRVARSVETPSYVWRNLRYDPIRDSEIVELSAQFAQGSQVRVSHEEKRRTEQVWTIPISPFDWLKALIVGWQPALDFGWLQPTYKIVEREVHLKIEETYFNVMPVAKEQTRAPYIQMRRMSSLRPLSEVDWLEGTPATRAEVDSERRLTAEECACYMSQR